MKCCGICILRKQVLLFTKTKYIVRIAYKKLKKTNFTQSQIKSSQEQNNVMIVYFYITSGRVNLLNQLPVTATCKTYQNEGQLSNFQVNNFGLIRPRAIANEVS